MARGGEEDVADNDARGLLKEAAQDAVGRLLGSHAPSGPRIDEHGGFHHFLFWADHKKVGALLPIRPYKNLLNNVRTRHKSWFTTNSW